MLRSTLFTAPVPKPEQPADNVDCPLHFCVQAMFDCASICETNSRCVWSHVPNKKKMVDTVLSSVVSHFFYFHFLNRLSVRPASGSLALCAKVCNFLKLLGFPTSLKRATRSSTGLLRWALWEGMAGTDREALRFGWRLLWHSGLPRSRVRKQR